MFSDTHAHLTMPEFSDISDVLGRAHDAGVELIIDAAYDLDSSERSIALAKESEIIYSAVGIHPHDAKTFDNEMIKTIKKLAQSPKVVAIGESGLDYRYKLSSTDDQKKLFIQLVRVAKDFDMPIIVHGRESYDDIIEILETEGKGEVRGVFHSFSGDIKHANWAIKNNFFISFSGMLTFIKANNIIEIAAAIPIENMLIETDCPYLTPEPLRGRRNEPAFVRIIADKLSKIKGVSMEDAGRITTKNARKLFKVQ